MRLAEFIVANMEPILAEWEAFARSLSPGAKMTVLDLRDHAESILRATARDMQSAQSLQQQASKSKGHGGASGAESDAIDHASSLHGLERVGSGFHITDVVSEYRALRASVLRLWRQSLPQPDVNDIDDITRFDESMDQSLAEAVSSYSKRVDQSRQMFLAILSHDLRNPLNCIRMAAQLVSREKDDPDSVEALALIETSTEAVTRLISDLVDFTLSGLGRTMPLTRGPVDLVRLCREVVEAYRTTNPGRTLRFHSDGDITGVWDAGRLRQVISNLMGNAIQHGSPEGPVELSVALEGSTPEESTVVLRVHNEGAPIPPDLLPTLFDPLVRYATRESAARRRPGSIGLGLYIVREIVVAKGGTVEVASTAQEGTTFTVRIPRILRVEGDSRDDAKAAR
ncbi:MAG TPA: HAMP domain-containing sensor histidine kinase [Vicinamibacterales bacterium]